MLCRVRLLRNRGRRLRWRDAVAEPKLEGEFAIYWMNESDKTPYMVACLKNRDTQLDRKLIELFEPVLIAAGNGGFGSAGSNASVTPPSFRSGYARCWRVSPQAR